MSKTMKKCLNISTKAQPDSVSTEFRHGYVIIFLHPKSKQHIFLAHSADIAAICYSDRPYLPGTLDPKLAKFYPDVESAKADIYTLRYHHRAFIKVSTIIKSAIKMEKDNLPNNLLDQSSPIVYYLDEAE